MNKLLQNKTINNHIKVFPLSDDLAPHFTCEADELNWCESIWNYLSNNSDLTRHKYVAKKASHTLSVWSDNDKVYLVQVMRTLFHSNKTIIYIAKKSEEQINDFLAIVKFVHGNIGTMMNNYRELIAEAKESQIKAMLDKDKIDELPNAGKA